MMNRDDLEAIFDCQVSSYDAQWQRTAPIRDGLLFLVAALLTELPPEAHILSVGPGAGEEIAALVCREIAAQNDEQFHQFLQQSFTAYRALNTRAMRLRGVHITPIDDLHCVARVGWTAIYARSNEPDITIEFDVHYLVQQRQETARIFGWVAGDEQAVLQAHGVGLPPADTQQN